MTAGALVAWNAVYMHAVLEQLRPRAPWFGAPTAPPALTAKKIVRICSVTPGGPQSTSGARATPHHELAIVTAPPTCSSLVN